MNTTTRGFLDDPAWLAHRYEPAGDMVQFVRAERARRRKIPFLTDEHLGPEAPRCAAGRAAALATSPTPAPLQFVFHSAFCCSTLLANALDAEGAATTTKEPVILNDISGWRRRGAEPKAVGARLGDALRLLARPFQPGEAVVIKPSNVVNALAPAMLALSPDSRAVMLFAPIRVFLASIASKGLWGRLWVRELAWKLMRDGVADFGLQEEELFRLSDLQVAALGWLAQHRLFAEMAARLGPERVRTLDSETLVARPAACVRAAGALFGLPQVAARAEAIAAGPVFRTNAKSGEAFGAEARAAAHRGAAEANADEIAKVAAWSEALAGHARVEMRPPSPLVG